MPGLAHHDSSWTGVTLAEKDHAAGRVRPDVAWDVEGRVIAAQPLDVEGRVLSGAYWANVAADNFSNDGRWADRSDPRPT